MRVSAWAWAWTVMALPRVPDARIDESVEHVDEDVDGHDGGAEQQHATLQHRIVPATDRLVEPLADAGPGEDRLRQDRAREERAHEKSDHRDHGNERVPKRVHADHERGRQALGARRADV